MCSSDLVCEDSADQNRKTCLKGLVLREGRSRSIINSRQCLNGGRFEWVHILSLASVLEDLAFIAHTTYHTVVTKTTAEYLSFSYFILLQVLETRLKTCMKKV